MEESTSKEKILKNIRNALINKLENPFQNVDFESPLYTREDEADDVIFATEFSRIGGKFLYCANEMELLNGLAELIPAEGLKSISSFDPGIRALLESAEIEILPLNADFVDIKVGVSYCQALLSRTGSILMTSAQASGRRLMAFANVHIVIAFASQLVPDIKDALVNLREQYLDDLPSMITVISGPSRTADIEKTLVMGAHGPKELYLFFVDDSDI
ncbi:MAG: LUD domain-containing protein [Bacteroidales bacterium]|nr:LUD domain-containing protein [Bacteroidales bacterium]